MNTINVHKLIALAFIDNPDKKPCVDHINNKKSDNNINNLRWVTQRENCMNSSFRNDNSSGIKGVNFHKKSNKWQAEINIDGIKIYLGTYDTIEQATQARVQRAKKAFGQYVSKCEGVKHDAKPMKIRKPKTVIEPIVKLNVQQIYDNIVQLNNTLKVELMKLL